MRRMNGAFFRYRKVRYTPIFLWILFLCFGIMVPDSSKAAEERLYHAQGKRDPFIPLVASTMRPSVGALLGVETIDDIQIEGIAVDPDPAQSVVVVNGSVMRTGEEVGSVKVLAIQKDGVQFSVNGTEAFKSLYQEENKD